MVSDTEGGGFQFFLSFYSPKNYTPGPMEWYMSGIYCQLGDDISPTAY